MELAAVDVLGVSVHAVDMGASTAIVEEAIRKRRGDYICVTGMHGVMEAQRDAELRDALNRALLNVPDGKPMVWVGRVRGHAAMQRVFGPDLMLEMCRISAQRGYTQFLYGSSPAVVEELVQALVARFPGLRIVGTCSPPFRPLTEAEASALEDRVRALRPDIFWIGLGTPKQERFMGEMAGRLDVGVSIGVGAAFDYHTGRLRDAPRWMKEGGLQWVHRLWQEPRRLWKRYALNMPPFVFLLLLQLAGIRGAGRMRP